MPNFKLETPQLSNLETLCRHRFYSRRPKPRMFYNDKKQRNATLPGFTSSLDLFKILYPKCYKYWSYPLAYEMSCLWFSSKFSFIATIYKHFDFTHENMKKKKNSKVLPCSPKSGPTTKFIWILIVLGICT